MIQPVRLLLLVFSLLLLLSFTATAQTSHRRGTGAAPKNEPAVAIVNGEQIPLKFYNALLQDRISYEGEGSLTQSSEDALFMQLVDAELLRQEAQRRKITVTHDEALKQLLNDPPQYLKDVFTDERGEFKREIFRQVVQKPELIASIATPGAPADSVIARWKADIDKVIHFIQNSQLRRRVADALYREKPLSANDIRYRYFAERTHVDGSFIRVLHSTIPDSLVPINAVEARQWYEQHLEDYRVPPSRTVGSLIVPITPLPKDSAAVQARISDARRTIESTPLAERSAAVSGVLRGLLPNRIMPDQPLLMTQIPEDLRDTLRHARPGTLLGPIYQQGEAVLFYVDGVVPVRDTLLRARHILLRVQTNDPSGDSTNRELIVALKENIPNDSVFIEAAKIYSQDATNTRGGDLGYFQHGKMLHEFDSAAFAAPVGEVVGPLRTTYGYHLIRVTDRLTDGYLLRELRFPITPSDEARQIVERDLQRYVAALRTNQPVADIVAELHGLHHDLVSDTSVIRRLEPYGDALAANRFAFNASVGDAGIVQLPYNRLMAIKLLKVWPDGVLPFDVIPTWPIAHARRARQLEILAPRMKQAANSITPSMLLGPLRDLAPMAEVFLLNNQVVNTPPDEHTTILDSLVAVTPPGKVSGPVRGTHGYYFLRVISRAAPTDADYKRDTRAFTEEYKGRYQDELVEKKLKELRSYAAVADMRSDRILMTQQ
jgi:parvulin-like peptidyl-prolyl isomerase